MTDEQQQPTDVNRMSSVSSVIPPPTPEDVDRSIEDDWAFCESMTDLVEQLRQHQQECPPGHLWPSFPIFAFDGWRAALRLLASLRAASKI